MAAYIIEYLNQTQGQFSRFTARVDAHQGWLREDSFGAVEAAFKQTYPQHQLVSIHRIEGGQ